MPIPSPRNLDTANSVSGGAVTLPVGAAKDVGSDKDKDAPFTLPPPKDLERLRVATAEVVELSLDLDEVAQQHGVDSETLHSWVRNYVRVYGVPQAEVELEPQDDALSIGAETDLVDGQLESGASRRWGKGEKPEFDRKTERQFNMNWAELIFRAGLDKKGPSPLRLKMMLSPLTGWMFQGARLDKLAISGVAIIASLAMLSVFFLTRSSAPAEETSAELDPSTGEYDHSGASVQRYSERRQAAVLERLSGELNDFVKIETWQERLPLVRDPERVRPLMEDYYARNPDGPIKIGFLNSEAEFIRRGETDLVLVTGQRLMHGGERQPMAFLVEMEGPMSKFKIDWEVLVNYEPVAWEQFESERSRDAAPFRVRAQLGEYYNYPFMDEETYLSLRLELFVRGKIVHAFVRRDSALGKEIVRTLDTKLSGSQAYILDLRYPQLGKFNDVLEVARIVSDRW